MSARVRVLSLIDELGFGGDENRLLSLAATIDRGRFDLEVVTIRRPDPARGESWAMHRQYATAGIRVSSLGEVPDLGVRRTRGPRHYVRAAARLVRKVGKLRRLVQAWRPDVIDAHLEPAGLVGVLAGALTRTPSVVTVYAAVPLVPPPLWSVMGRLVFGFAHAVLTDSEARRHDIRCWMPSAAARVHVVPNGIAPPEATRTRSEMRARLGIPADPRVRVIGQVAALDRHKGHLHLLDAASIVCARAADVVFLLVGFPKNDPDYGDEVTHRIRSLGLGDRVRMTSYPGPIGDVWSAIDIQVHASTYDSLPNALIEGMSLGKPIVATTVGGIPDMLEDGRSALLVAPGDGGGLATALLRVLTDAPLATRIGAAAHDRYRVRHGAATMTRALEECFAGLAVGTRPVADARLVSREGRR
jgi:glycosyltransferase involved in cell wall biosynthesis